jgi:hypothetical protein
MHDADGISFDKILPKQTAKWVILEQELTENNLRK